MASSSRGFWITNHFANHFVRPLLRGPLGSWAGGKLALLRVPGRRTGHVYEVPVQFTRDGNTIWVEPGIPDRKTWWRNLRGDGQDITLRVAGREHRGHAIALELPDRVRVRIDLAGDRERN